MAALDEQERSGEDPLASPELIDLQVARLDSVKKTEGEIDEVQKALSDRREYLAQVSIVQPESDGRYQELNSVLTRLQSQLERDQTAGRKQILAVRQKELAVRRQEERSKIAASLQDLKVRGQQIKEQYDERVTDLQASGGQSIQLEFVRAELERFNKIFELIATKSIALQTESRAPERITKKPAVAPPVLPIEQIPYKHLLLFCSVGLVAPFGLAVAEALVRRINDVVQLAHESRLHVLGEISALPVRYLAATSRKLMPGLRRASYVFAESINSLRTNLAMSSQLGKRQVLAVTSATSGEGKSSVATSLAMSIAETTGAKTLIIDGDMRSPDVATMLKTPSRPGLYDLLSGKCTVDEAIHRVGEGPLFVLPAGAPMRNPHLVLKLAEMKQILNQLRGQFSSIIIDTPPILGASESLILAKAADMTIFCSLCDVSRAKQVRLAVERLEHTGANVAGAVLSGTSVARYASVYGYYANPGEREG